MSIELNHGRDTQIRLDRYNKPNPKSDGKIRADLLLVQRGHAASRHQAQALLLAGQVFSRGERVSKAGTLIAEDLPLEIRKPIPFVGRGGVKLDHALTHFRIDPVGWTVLDAGASTGGFTDCLLQRGAGKVYAVDVGHGQFASRLRGDPRVILLERTNVRYLNRETIPDLLDLVVADLAFISLTKVLTPLASLVGNGGHLVLLVKPQFELGPREAKKGVVRALGSQAAAVRKVEEAAEALGLLVAGETPSPLRGPKGNQEHFLHLIKSAEGVK